MIKLSDITRGTRVKGIEPDQTVQVIDVIHSGADAATVTYRTTDNRLGERTLFIEDQENLEVAQEEISWDFTGDPDAFKLAVEAYRINVAHLFDPMMAVHTSNVEPLPHQITAVYSAMLPRQPLRFVLADDPGAGKTIMAGLLIKELILRGDADRVLIVAPGSLVGQWQEELLEKFGLEFDILSKDDQDSTKNPFERRTHVICRLDQLSRNEDLANDAAQISWDLVIFDEAHKLGARFSSGNTIDKTKRFELGELLGSSTRHFLLMTATPHNGKEEDFQLFLSLLDGDRFYGKQRDGSRKANVEDLMRRMVKEDLRRFDGSKLFPERRAQTVTYELSDIEQTLYEAVTRYVRQEMNRAERLQGDKRIQIGFALASLQRRLASSPAAIFKSLDNRLKRLNEKLDEVRGGGNLQDTPAPDLPNLEDLEDDLPDEEYETYETEVVSHVTAAQTESELLAEIDVVRDLREQAYEVKLSGQDRKWEKLSELLQNTPEMRDARGQMRKLIIFTEYKDTLEYLKDRIQNLLGNPSAVVEIQGSTGRDQRKAIQEDFCNVPEVLVLVATDAASEGINLQRATNLMINYDLPWNPNRLEQRFGRIHRIGQEQICWLWNMVAGSTREGEVYQRLLQKLEIARKALGGRVFDILGELFEEKPLRQLLIDAIRYGEDSSRLTDIDKTLDSKLSEDAIRQALELKKNMLAEEALSTDQIYKVKEEMDKAEAMRLQPYFVRSFFLQAAKHLQMEVRERGSSKLFELPYVPQRIQQRDRLINGRDRRYAFPVSRRYERICFEQSQLNAGTKPTPVLMHPAHPLMQAMTDIVLEDTRSTLNYGAVMVDPQANPSDKPYLLVLMEHSVREGSEQTDRVISRQVQFVKVALDGEASNAGWAPHLDLVAATTDERKNAQKKLDAPNLTELLTKTAPHFATGTMARTHFSEIKNRREEWVAHTLQAVHERLNGEIAYLTDRLFKIEEEIAAGKQPKVQASNLRERIDEIEQRLERRKRELERQRNLVSLPSRVISCTLVVPTMADGQAAANQVDAAAKARIEHLAMTKVSEIESAKGNKAIDVSADNCGWDITSRPPLLGDLLPDDLHIEVKGRQYGQTTVTVSRNEVITGLNQGDRYVLAVALVDGSSVRELYYVKAPFSSEPDWAEASKNLDLTRLLSKAERIELESH